MKRKRFLLIIISSIFIIGIASSTVYFYIQMLEEEYMRYSSQLPFSYDGSNSDEDLETVEIFISEFDEKKCTIDYCVLGNCDNQAVLPCRKLGNNEYKGEGFYLLSLDFKSSLLLKSVLYLKNWDIKSVDKEEGTYSKQSYIDGLKYLLSEYPIYKNYICVIPNPNSEVDSWQCDKEEFLSHEYLKTVYLLYELGSKLADKEILNYVEEEITYLNSKTEDFINERIKNPDAYLVKLVEVGLDKKYLGVIKDFIVPEFGEIELEQSFQSSPSLRADDNSTSYNMISEFADNFLIFNKEPGYEDFARYYKFMLIREYNQSDLAILSFCTVANSLGDESMITDLKRFLEESINSDFKTESFSNIRELHQCVEYINNQGEEIEDLENRYLDLLQKSTISTPTGSYVTNVSEVFSEEREQNIFMIEYKMLDNIMYLLYE